MSRVTEWRKANPEKAAHLRLVEKTKLQADPTRFERKRIATKAFIESHPDYYREYQLVQKYGITLAEYNEMHAAQGGVCKVCKQPETAIIKGKLAWLSVDHNHTTLKVRGLLCAKCNKVVGLLQDSVTNAEALVAYLRT